MKKMPEFEWDKDERTMHCCIYDAKGRVAYGSAICHEEDADMMSEKTGAEIAFRRAKIQQLCIERDQDLKPRLAALNQLYYSMQHSSNFNPNSYENRMLQRQIRLINFDLTTIKEKLAYERENLKDLINEKDKFYQQVRKHRQGQN